jgi:hypothetical protein
MTNKALSEVIDRGKSWPDEAQEELAAIARDLDGGLRGDFYYPTDEEIAGIEQGLRAAERPFRDRARGQSRLRQT